MTGTGGVSIGTGGVTTGAGLGIATIGGVGTGGKGLRNGGRFVGTRVGTFVTTAGEVGVTHGEIGTGARMTGTCAAGALVTGGSGSSVGRCVKGAGAICGALVIEADVAGDLDGSTAVSSVGLGVIGSPVNCGSVGSYIGAEEYVTAGIVSTSSSVTGGVVGDGVIGAGLFCGANVVKPMSFSVGAFVVNGFSVLSGSLVGKYVVRVVVGSKYVGNVGKGVGSKYVADVGIGDTTIDMSSSFSSKRSMYCISSCAMSIASFSTFFNPPCFG